jgi:amino acid adenylation domain-containing protein
VTSLGKLFERSLLKYKDRVAVRSGLQVFTYEDINDISNHIASFLKQYGVNKGEHVGLYTEKSELTLFYILALIKMGVPYVPIDPQSPKERTKHIIHKSNIVLLLGDKSIEGNIIQSFPCPYLNVQDLIEKSMETQVDVQEIIQYDDPAYMIFTSGSTGEPKGVCVTHGNVISLFEGCNNLFEFSHEDKWTFFHSHAFDFSVWEIWGAWLYGGEVNVVTFEESRNPLAFVDLMVQSKTTVFNCTPSAFFEIKEELLKRQHELQLRYIIFGGESLNFRKLLSWFEELDGKSPKLINMYGITETTVHVTFKEISFQDAEKGITNIGKVLPHLGSIVIKEDESYAKEGEEGELFICGKGLSLGYYQNKDMNDQKFIYIEGIRYYKTGDIVKKLPNQELQYISRNDHQVQVRGFRIELGEIESAFNEIDAIKNAVAIADKIFNDDIHIILYYVEKEKVSVETLKNAVIEKLPSYMIPSYFFSVDSIPMTANGKLDKRKLPNIQKRKNSKKNMNESLIHTNLRKIVEEVIGIYMINEDESLLANGMNSLSIMRLISRVNNIFKIEISPAIILMNDTIRKLSNVIQEIEEVDENNSSRLSPISPQHQMVVPLSYEQENLWFIDQTSEDRSLYNLIFSYEIIGDIQLDKLVEAFNQLAREQQILNSVIYEKGGKGWLTYRDSIYHSINFNDLTDLSTPEQQKKIDNLIYQEAERSFNFANEPLISIHLQKKRENKYLLIINIHHIIFDGWSLPLLINGWFSLYEILISSNNQKIDSIAAQYSDYAIWQRKSRDFIKKKDLQFWHKEVELEFKPLLQYDYPKVNNTPQASKVLHFTLSDELYENIKQFNIQSNSTLFISLLSAFQTFLSAYYDEEQIVVGSPVANRTHPNIENTIGYFVNTLPFKTSVQKNDTFHSFLKRNILVTSEILAHQHVPTEQILKQVKLKRRMNSNIFFDTVFVLQNHNQVLNFKTIQLKQNKVDSSKAKFDLVVQAEEWDGRLTIVFEYNKSLFKDETVQRMARNFNYWLAQIFGQSDQKLLDLKFIEPDQRDELIKISSNGQENLTNKDFEDVITKFKKSVEKFPNKIAAVHGDNKISYRELDEKSNVIANYLRQKGVSPQQKIGVFMNRSIDMVASVLSIMKLGAVYVPLDPSQPKSRLEYMIDDAILSYCLIDRELLAKYPNKQDNLVVVNYLDEKKYVTTTDFISEKIEESQLAYIIYTSGTTGNPKGVMIEHASLSNLCEWHISYYRVEESDSALLVSSISFDASLWELFPYITNGNKVVIVDYYNLLDVDLLAEKLEEQHVTIAFFSTGLLEQLFINEMTFPSSIRAILTGGDRLKTLPEKLSFDLYNNYGPTEGTVVSTVYKIESVEERIIPIGKPIRNVETLVLNSNYKLVPKGQIGELFIGGIGLARGYIGQNQKNSESFIPHPFDAKRKLYKTGDLVKYNENNQLIFSGRQDDQIKIRGYRVELGEINAVLKQYDDIKDCVITVNDESNARKYISAYYLANQEIKQADLERYLESRLPSYMIPSYFIHMEQFPLTQNGKIEIKKLPNPKDNVKKENQIAETNEIEQTLLMIWKSVLKNENITIFDNYFECGGDSILSIQICSMAKTYGLLITSRDIFENQSIHNVSKVAKFTKEIHHSQSEVTGEMPLTPIQKWFFQQDIEQYHHWNQSIVMTGYPLLNKQRLEQIINLIFEHHDALRTTYDIAHRTAFIQPTKQGRNLWNVKYIDLSHENVEKQKVEVNRIELEAQQSLNISNGPLSQILCVKINEHAHKIIWIIHHLNIDGVSWRILIEDFEKLYGQSVKQIPLSLDNKTTSFKAWGEKLTTYQKCIDKDIYNYWLNVCSKSYEDKLIKSNDINKYEESAFEITLNSKITEKISGKLTRRYQATTDELYLSVLTKIIGEYFGKKEIHFNLEGHGREELFSDIDLSRTIGWFTSVYPIYLRNESSFEKTIRFTKQKTKEIPNKGLEYGLLKELEGKVVFNENTPLISFNNLGKYYSSDDEQSEIVFFSKNDIPQNLYTDHEINIELITVNNEQKISVHFNNYFTGVDFESYFTKRLYQLFDEIESESNDVEEDHLGTILDTYELTDVQKGMLYHSLVDEDSDQYKVQLTFTILGDLDVSKLKNAILKTVEKHDILRTFFISDKSGLFYQNLMQYIHTPINYEDLNEVDWQEKLNRLKDYEYQQINIENNKLNRFLIVKSKEAYDLIWTFHHILMDGWSYSTIIHDIFTCYDARNAITDAPTPFKSYVEYMQHYIKRPVVKTFWKEYLKNAQLITTEFLSDTNEKYSETIFNIKLDEQRMKDINQFCMRNKLTVNTFFLSIWLMTLKKVKQSDYVSCGVVTSGRGVPIPGIENMVGPFINTVPFFSPLFEEESPEEIMIKIQQSIFGIMEYSNTPLSVIQEVTGIANPLFDSLYAFENYPMSLPSGDHLQVTLQEGKEITHYPIAVTVIPGSSIEIKFNDTLLDDELRKSIISAYENIMEEIIEGIYEETINEG